MSAELAKDARSPEDLLAQHRDDNYAWIVIIKPDSMLKIKTMTPIATTTTTSTVTSRKDTNPPDADIPASQLLSWLRSEVRDRDSKAQARLRSLPLGETLLAGGGVGLGGGGGGGVGGGGTSSGSWGVDRDHGQQQLVRVLVAQTKSKKFNRQTVVEQAQVSATKLVQSFLEVSLAGLRNTPCLVRHVGNALY